jgi:hypothetical protein
VCTNGLSKTLTYITSWLLLALMLYHLPCAPVGSCTCIRACDMLVWEGRQHDCNDDSQVRSAPSDFSSAPSCLAARIYVSQCMFLYDHHWPAGTQLILGFVQCCMLHMLRVCLLKHDSAYADLWPSTAFNCIQSYTAHLWSSVCHIFQLCKVPMCGK